MGSCWGVREKSKETNMDTIELLYQFRSEVLAGFRDIEQKQAEISLKLDRLEISPDKKPEFTAPIRMRTRSSDDAFKAFPDSGINRCTATRNDSSYTTGKSSKKIRPRPESLRIDGPDLVFMDSASHIVMGHADPGLRSPSIRTYASEDLNLMLDSENEAYEGTPKWARTSSAIQLGLRRQSDATLGSELSNSNLVQKPSNPNERNRAPSTSSTNISSTEGYPRRKVMGRNRQTLEVARKKASRIFGVPLSPTSLPTSIDV